MKCTRFRKLLIPYAEGSLPAESAASLEQHLAECGACSAELRSLTCTVDVLKKVDYPAFEPAFDLRSRVLAEIANEPARKPWWQASRMQAYSAAMAGLLLVAIAGAGMWRTMERGVEVRVSAPPSVRHRQAQTQAARPARPAPAPAVKAPRDVARRSAAPKEAAKDSAGRPLAMGDRVYGIRPLYSDDKSPNSGVTWFDRDRQTPAMSKAVTPVTTPPVSTDGVSMGYPPLADDTSAGAYGGYGRAREPEQQLSNRTKQSDLGGTQNFYTLRSVEPEAPSAAAGVSAAPAPTGPASPDATIAETFDGVGEEAISRAQRIPGGNSAMGNMATDYCADVTLGVGIAGLAMKLQDFPTSVTTITDLMMKYREARMPKDEYKMAQRLTQLDPDNAGYWLSRAQAADRVPMPKTAQACYQRAVKLGLKGADLDQAQKRITELKK